MKIRQSGDFDRMYEALITTHPELAEIVLKQVEQFVKNSNDTRLDNHEPHKSMEGQKSTGNNRRRMALAAHLGALAIPPAT